VLALIFFAIWVCQQACQGVKSVDRTTKAIGEWNNEQLSKREKRIRELEAELRKLR